MKSIKAKLKALSLIDSKVKSKRLEIASLRSSVIKSPTFSDEPKGGNYKNSSEELNVRIIEKTEEIYREISKIYDTRDKLVKAIDNMEDPLQSQILRLKYVNGYSWSKIKRELPMFAESTLFEYHTKGLQVLEKLTEFSE